MCPTDDHRGPVVQRGPVARMGVHRRAEPLDHGAAGLVATRADDLDDAFPSELLSVRRGLLVEAVGKHDEGVPWLEPDLPRRLERQVRDDPERGRVGIEPIGDRL